MLYNIISVFFGLLALGVPARVLLGIARPGAWGVLASGSCCAAALGCQLLEVARRASLADLAAVADTVQTSQIAQMQATCANELFGWTIEVIEVGN